MHPMSRSRSRPRSPEAVRVDGLRRKVVAIDRRLVVVNGVCFTSLVVLAGAAPGLLATQVAGQVNLGLLLCVALGVLTLSTSVLYDRRMSRECDPEADGLRERAEERESAIAAEAQNRAAAQQRWGAGPSHVPGPRRSQGQAQGYGFGYGQPQSQSQNQNQGQSQGQSQSQSQNQGWREW